jgi:hypothetical protein
MKEEVLQYENRDKLYQFLIDDFGFVKLDESYSATSFGNFYIDLSSDSFLVRYVNDRSFLNVEIAPLYEPSKWYSLSFVENFIYHQEDINPDEREISNAERIERLNMFLKRDFDLIVNLYNKENYKSTLEKIDALLKISFEQRFPGWTKQ